MFDGGRPMHDPTQADRRPVIARREFLAAAGFWPALAAMTLSPRAVTWPDDSPRRDRFFFTSQGKTGLVNADGTGLRYLRFDKPGQATWQPAAVFPDGRRVLLLSMEP